MSDGESPKVVLLVRDGPAKQEELQPLIGYAKHLGFGPTTMRVLARPAYPAPDKSLGDDIARAILAGDIDVLIAPRWSEFGPASNIAKVLKAIAQRRSTDHPARLIVGDVQGAHATPAWVDSGTTVGGPFVAGLLSGVRVAELARVAEESRIARLAKETARARGSHIGARRRPMPEPVIAAIRAAKARGLKRSKIIQEVTAKTGLKVNWWHVQRALESRPNG